MPAFPNRVFGFPNSCTGVGQVRYFPGPRIKTNVMAIANANQRKSETDCPSIYPCVRCSSS